MTATREEWLTAATRALASRLTPLTGLNGVDAPTVLASHPARQGRKVRLCEVTTDAEGSALVFVSPYLSDPAEVLAVLAYALAEVGATSREAATRRMWLGFAEGKAIVPGAMLRQTLAQVADTLPPYPHVYTDPAADRARTQTTRMLRVSCDGAGSDAHDPYALRMTRTQIERGLPYCGVCAVRMTTD